MQAEIFAIGEEILMGEIVDTNSGFMAARLPALGVRVRRMCALPDHLPTLTQAFKDALARSELILCTGGLGPTDDDLTREAIAEALGEALTIDPDLKASQEHFWASRNMAMPPSNLRQATRIPSATAIPNPRGTAPGWWVEKSGRIIVTMPGVPAEFHYMWENEVAPRLKKTVQGTVILSRAIKTYGYSESGLGEKVKHLFGKDNPYLGIYAKPDGIHLRIIARAPSDAHARALIAPMEAEIRQIIGEHTIWGYDDETPEERLGDALRRTKSTLATMESCTGGLLANLITDISGSSDYFLGGYVTYTNQAKIAQGVDPTLIAEHGAISAPVAEAMAVRARRNLNANYGIGITGVAGPNELEGKPPGTIFVGFAWEGGTSSLSFRIRLDRQLVKRRTVTQAMLQMRKLVLEHGAVRA